MSARDVIDRAMTETEWQALVVDYARLRGWLCAHFRPARTVDGQWRTAVAYDGEGWPDLVLVREVVLYRELKTQRGHPTPEQLAWGVRLTRAGGDWGVWRPSDWAEVEAALR